VIKGHFIFAGKHKRNADASGDRGFFCLVQKKRIEKTEELQMQKMGLSRNSTQPG
jgi:hypothetical protein